MGTLPRLLTGWLWAGALLALAGCAAAGQGNGSADPASAPTSSSASVTPNVPVSPGSSVQTPQGLCLTAFRQDQLLAWAGTSLQEVRAWHYGGPTPQAPFADLYPALPGATTAAWCNTTSNKKGYTQWWVLAAGQQPQSLLDGYWPDVGTRGETGVPIVP